MLTLWHVSVSCLVLVVVVCVCPLLASRPVGVGVSECRGVGVSGGVGVSKCRSVETLRVAHHETHLRERSLSDW